MKIVPPLAVLSFCASLGLAAPAPGYRHIGEFPALNRVVRVPVGHPVTRIEILDREHGEILHTLDWQDPSSPRVAALSLPEQGLIALGATRGLVRVQSLTSGAILGEVNLGRETGGYFPRDMVFTRDGRWLLVLTGLRSDDRSLFILKATAEGTYVLAREWLRRPRMDGLSRSQ